MVHVPSPVLANIIHYQGTFVKVNGPVLKRGY